MKLYDAKFYRELRRRVRREVEMHPEGPEAQKRSVWTRHFGLESLRGALPLLFVVMGRMNATQPWFWPTLGIWVLLLGVLRAAQTQELGSGRGGMRSFLLLPISDGDIFRFVSGRVLRASVWLLADAIGVLVGICWALHPPLIVWLAVPVLAALLWSSAMATAILLLWWRPRFPYAAGALLVMVMGVVQHLAPEQVKAIGTFFLWLSPPGWAAQAVRWIMQGGDIPLVALGLLAAALAGAVPAYRLFESSFYFREPEPADFPPTVEERDDETQAAVERDFAGEFLRESRASEVEQGIGTRGFLTPLRSTPQGWIERLISTFLRRDAVLLDFLTCGLPRWSQTFRFGLILLAGGLLAGWLLSNPAAAAIGDFFGAMGGFLVALTIGLGLLCITPIFGGLWPGCDLRPFGHGQIAMIAALPVGLRQCSRLILKVNAIRFLLALPCWLTVAWLLALIYHTELRPVMGLSLEAWLAALLIQPFWLVFTYSKGTKDTTSGCLGFIFIVGAFLGALGLLITAFVILVAASAWWAKTGAILGLVVVACGFEAIYRWCYNSPRGFDLLAKSPTGQ